MSCAHCMWSAWRAPIARDLPLSYLFRARINLRVIIHIHFIPFLRGFRVSVKDICSDICHMPQMPCLSLYQDIFWGIAWSEQLLSRLTRQNVGSYEPTKWKYFSTFCRNVLSLPACPFTCPTCSSSISSFYQLLCCTVCPARCCTDRGVRSFLLCCLAVELPAAELAPNTIHNSLSRSRSSSLRTLSPGPTATAARARAPQRSSPLRFFCLKLLSSADKEEGSQRAGGAVLAEVRSSIHELR